MSMVEWKKLGEVCTFNRGRTITAKDTVGGDIPVIAGGQTPSYYHSEFNRKGESITVAGSGAYAGFVAYWNQPIFVSDAFTVDPSDKLLHKYLFHWLKMNQQKIFATQKGAGVPHVHGRDIANIQIPIPSLSEQSRIVGILDTFTASIANLKEQIGERRKQYEHYRDQLLDLEGKEGVEMKTLGEVCEKIFSGKNKSKNSVGEYPVFGSTGIIAYSDNYVYDKPHILVARVGANAGFVYISHGKYDVTDNALIIDLKDFIEEKYIYHLLVNENLNKYAKGGGQPLVTGSILKELIIPIPSLSEQSRIVSILDQFEASIANLEAQLQEREKQYEHYRNLLLTFE